MTRAFDSGDTILTGRESEVRKVGSMNFSARPRTGVYNLEVVVVG
jgi:hypothetical protein